MVYHLVSIHIAIWWADEHIPVVNGHSKQKVGVKIGVLPILRPVQTPVQMCTACPKPKKSRHRCLRDDFHSSQASDVSVIEDSYG